MSSCNCRIVALLFPILSVPSCQSIVRKVSPYFSIQHFPILHLVANVPCYVMCVFLFYYSSHWGPVPKKAGQRKSNFTPRLFLTSYILNEILSTISFMFPLFFSWARGIGIKFVLSLCRGGRCLQGNLWYSPPVSMTSRLASVTFKMASKVFIEEADKNFDFIKETLFRFLGFADFKVSIVIENQTYFKYFLE